MEAEGSAAAGARPAAGWRGERGPGQHARASAVVLPAHPRRLNQASVSGFSRKWLVRASVLWSAARDRRFGSFYLVWARTKEPKRRSRAALQRSTARPTDPRPTGK